MNFQDMIGKKFSCILNGEEISGKVYPHSKHCNLLAFNSDEGGWDICKELGHRHRRR